MYRQTTPITNITGVGAGQVATVDLPTDRRYHALYFEYTESGTKVTQANMEAAITDIKLLLNSRVQRQYSAAELNVINAVNGSRWNFQAGMIPIFFSEPWRRTPGGEDLLAWALKGNGIDSFQVEITIAAGRVSPALSGRAIIDYAMATDAQGRAVGNLPLAPIVTTRRRAIGVSATGDRSLIDMPRNLGDYLRLHAFETADGDISQLRVTVDQLIAYDRTADYNNAILINDGFQTQTALFHAIFDDDQRPTDGLPMTRADGTPVAELQLDFTMAVANDFTLLAEMIGGAS